MSFFIKGPKVSKSSTDRSSKSGAPSRRNTANDSVSNILKFELKNSGGTLNEEAGESESAGFYTWRIADNLLRGDAAVAHLFGFDAGETDRGMSVLSYMDRIHLEDRARVADIVREAVISGSEYQATYRIVRPDGTALTVTAYAHLFQEGSEDPGTWVGLVHHLPESSGTASLIQQCLSAYTMAAAAGYIGVAGQIREALADLIALLS